MANSLRLFNGVILTAAFSLPQPALAHGLSMTFVMEKFPPFIIDDKGKGTGPFPEVVRAACAELKIECHLKVLPWRRAFSMAEAGKVDGIFVLARTAEREKSFHFSDPVFQSSFAVIVRESGANYSTPDDLSGYTVVTYGPSAISKEMQEVAKSIPIKLLMEIDNESVLRKLRMGRYPEPAAAVMNRDVGLELIAQEKLTGLKVAGDFKPVTYAIGFPRQRISQERADEFNRVLRALFKDGKVKAIADRYGLKPAS